MDVLKITRIGLLALLIMTANSLVHAQSRLKIQGYLCKNIDDAKIYDQHNPYGSMGLRVGNRIEFFRVVVFGIPMHLTHYGRRAWPRKDKIGVGYIVKYKIIGEEKQAITIYRNGRSKRVEVCKEG
jgi:hypothetical protein